MNRLTISHAELVNPHWVALRFQGDDDAFRPDPYIGDTRGKIVINIAGTIPSA